MAVANGSGSFTLQFLTMHPEKLEGCQACAVAAAHLFDFGSAPWRTCCRFRKFLFNRLLQSLKISGSVLELCFEPHSCDVVGLYPGKAILLEFSIHWDSPSNVGLIQSASHRNDGWRRE